MSSSRKKRPAEFGAKGIRVAASKGKGRGVFATGSFKEGDLIEIAPVLIIPEKDWPFVSTTYLGDYFFEREEGEAVIALGSASLYNHSFKCNAEYMVAADKIIITAVSDISKGDEVTIDYGWDSAHYYECGIIDKEECRIMSIKEAEEDSDDD